MKTLIKKSFLALTLFIAILCFMGSLKANAQADIRYCGYGNIMTYATETSRETITYTKRQITYTEITKGVPFYKPISELSNSCGPTAGAIVVGFYDKYYEELIPDYTTYVAQGTYKGNDSVYIPQVMRELYTLMRTNVDDVGVGQTDCLNGLSTYVSNHGRSIQYSNVLSSNRISENSYINAINNNYPTLLFCSKMDLYSFAVTSTSETLICNTYSGGHIAVAYGLFVVDYYNGDSIFRTEKYLRVATGYSTVSTGYIKINSTDWCNAAYSVVVS